MYRHNILIAGLLVLSSFGLQAQNATKLVTPTNDTVITSWNSGGNALDTLVNIAFQNRIPFGIVIEGKALCTRQVNGKQGDTVAALLSDIETDIPGYTGQIEKGVLVIRPKLLTPSTLNALRVNLPEFGTAHPDTIQSLSITLWMFLRAALVPGQSSAFSGGVQRNAELIPAFHTSNTTTEEVLAYLVTQKTGGIWAMSQVPEDWISDPATIPFKVYSYSGDPGLAETLTCS